MGTTDLELLQRWRNGCETSGAALFDRHFPAVYRFFANKACGAVDDVVQQTFLACLEAKDRFRGDCSFRTYLFAVARNVLLQHYDRRRRDGRVDYEHTTLHDLGPSLSSIAARRAEMQLVAEALRRIPIIYQIAIELYYIEGIRGPELARVLDIPLPTVRSRIRRGLERLRDQIEQLAGSVEIRGQTLASLGAWAESLRADMDPPGQKAEKKPRPEP